MHLLETDACFTNSSQQFHLHIHVPIFMSKQEYIYSQLFAHLIVYIYSTVMYVYSTIVHVHSTVVHVYSTIVHIYSIIVYIYS